MKKIQVLCFGIFAVLGSPIASAHGMHGIGFMAGLVHPLLGFDHVLALLGMGAGVAAFGARRRWAAAGLMLSGLLAGLFSGLQANFSIDPWLGATLVLLAAMLLRQKVFSASLRLPLIAALACLHGFAHGMAWPQQQAMMPFALGVACTSLALFALGMTLRHARTQAGFGGLLGIAGLGFLFGA